MEKHTLSTFVSSYVQRERGQGEFELENERILEINLNGEVWIKMGAMIAYRGRVKFTREGIFERGVGTLVKRVVTGEGGHMSKATGVGTVYIADQGKKITVLNLQEEAVCVNGSDLLALQTSVDYKVKMMKKIGGAVAGGLFNVRVGGAGLVAIGTQYDPVVLEVSPDNPVATDPNSTVAWSDTLDPEIKIDASFKTLMGRGSGDSVQMLFRGSGFVVIQPLEETSRA
jgi:uncharacterized protein (AIM24 family)